MKKLARQNIERELIESQKSLREGKSGITLLDTLKSKFPQSHGFFLLHCIPEQGEDIFEILTSPKTVTVVEILRDGKQLSELVSCKQISVQEYMKWLSPLSRKRLDIAVKLIAEQSVCD
jgi:hypothetical protein